MASEEKRMTQPSLDTAPMGAFHVKNACPGDYEDVSTPNRKKISLFREGTAAARKAFKVKVKSKKVSARMAVSATRPAVDGDVVETAAARAKKVIPGKLGPLYRRPVLNGIVCSFYKRVTSIFHQKDMKVVDDVLNDLPRATRSEPTAVILPQLEGEWM